jgi:hypothetical protein
MTSLKPCVGSLNESQKGIYPLLSEIKDMGFVLYGGTAVSLLFGHHESVDFDLFSSKPLDDVTKFKLKNLNSVFRDSSTFQDSENTFSMLTHSNVKISFFGGLGFGRVGEPIMTSDSILLIASPYDLLGTKLKTLIQRV